MMDVTSLLNTAAAATEGKLQPVHERKESSDEELMDSLQTPSATTSDSTAPSSIVATPSEKTPSRRSSDSKTPNRNRTPWDAGGYSLSLALDDTKKFIQSSPGSASASFVTGLQAHADPLSSSTASPEKMDLAGSGSSPKSESPRHKFSDSRSSFSSAYTNASSTNNSVSHSRLSSLSTVSENQPLATLITDFSLLETRISDPSSLPCYNNKNNNVPQVAHANQHQLKLQQYSFTTQTSPEKQDFQPESPTPVRSRHNRSFDASPEPSPRSPGRARSPSDAILIPRAGQTAGMAEAEADALPGQDRLQIPSSHARSHSRSSPLQSSSSPTRRHKRAVSAPDFPSVGPSSFNPRFPTFGPIPEPTPSPSQHSDGNMMEHDMLSSSPAAGDQLRPTASEPSTRFGSSTEPTSERNTSAPAAFEPQNNGPMASGPNHHHQTHSSVTSVPDNFAAADTPDNGPANFDVASVCMYRGDCQTGSQLRKAISHIFGRNKLCTRMIPTGVWVHYCRKHYQRTRYRNGGEYPQRQIGLVQLQVRRVQAWSDSNTQKGQGPILKDWSLSVRKREQMRLDNKMAVTGKKRPFHDDGEEEDDGFDDERGDMSGTAVPDWVVARIGDGYSTADILSVVDRLKSDIDQGRLQQIPDIEILPNIVTDSNADEANANSGTAKKTYTKRRTVGAGAGAGGGHRRSQSVNTSALRSDATPMIRRRSQPSNFLPPSIGPQLPRLLHADQLPLEKRQRVDVDGILREQGPNVANERFEPALAAGTNPLSRPGFGSRLQLAHRPAFAGIRESQAESQGYYYSDNQQFGATGNNTSYQPGQQSLGASASDLYENERCYSGAPGGPSLQSYETRRDYDHRHSNSISGTGSHSGYGLLPAPNPQRYGGPSVAQQLETSSYVLNSAVTRRTGSHQRSQSEAGFLHQLPPSHYARPTSSSGHPPPPFGGPSTAVANGAAVGIAQGDVGSAGSWAYNAREDDRVVQGSGVDGYHNRLHYTQHTSHVDAERRGSIASQPPYAYRGGSGDESYDKFENVQLPPLQSIQSHPHSQQLHRSSVLGGGNPAADRQLSAVSGISKHSRHQSSPAVTRMLPATIEMLGSSSFAGTAQTMSSALEDNRNFA